MRPAGNLPGRASSQKHAMAKVQVSIAKTHSKRKRLSDQAAGKLAIVSSFSNLEQNCHR